MQLVLEYGLEPKNMAAGAIAGIVILLKNAEENNLPNDLRLSDWQNLDNTKIEKIINWLWSGKTNRHADQIIKQTQSALKPLIKLIKE
jgi:hypothetical protein